ncbi:MAG: hypothetical protein VCB25_02830 [Myxococcota bacterium]
MTGILRPLMFLLVLIFGTACLDGAGALAPCDPRGLDSEICGWTNPEDMSFLPDRSWIIVSEMAPNQLGVAEQDRRIEPGRLTALRLGDLARRVLYPPTSSTLPRSTTSAIGGAPEGVMEEPTLGEGTPTNRRWGDEQCAGEPDRAVFQPHGIDVGWGPDRVPALAVVNHGGREAIEFFEIIPGHFPSLVWRGCVLMPPGMSHNDVALLPGGGFVVTNFMRSFEKIGPRALWTMLKIGLGMRTGSVLQWQPGTVIREIENSQGSAPNGIAVSPDGHEIWVAEWGGKSIYRLRLSDSAPPLRDEIQLDQNPDNFSWMRDGRLLVAGQHGGLLASLGCASIKETGCDIGYSVYAIDSSSTELEATKLFEGRGAASVALEVGDEIFVGFFIGDQIERLSGK